MTINELIEIFTDIKEQIGGEQSVFFSDSQLCAVHDLGNVYVEHDASDGEAYALIAEKW